MFVLIQVGPFLEIWKLHEALEKLAERTHLCLDNFL